LPEIQLREDWAVCFASVADFVLLIARFLDFYRFTPPLRNGETVARLMLSRNREAEGCLPALRNGESIASLLPLRGREAFGGFERGAYTRKHRATGAQKSGHAI